MSNTLRKLLFFLLTPVILGAGGYAQSDFEETLRRAQQGDALAQERLGRMYYDGEGVPKDYQESLKWYRKAAEQGDAFAQASLGLMYRTGEGVSKDYQESLKWFRMAAEQGFTLAQYILGYMYYDGEGVPQDYKEAVRWSRKAAEQGFTLAQYILGYMYYDGEGVPQDYVLAYMWINLAASNSTEEDVREQSSKMRDELEKNMTPEQIAEAQRRSREWKPKGKNE